VVSGGVEVIDFNYPTRPREVAWYDVARSDRPAGTTGPPTGTSGRAWAATLTIHAINGVHDPAAVVAAGRRFNVFRVNKAVQEARLRRLNPQIQELLIR
jgi:hypothetical protein